MIKEILFVHHTHTDIGYTHPQPVVFELHRRFIEQALDLAEATAEWPDESRFRWTCEVTGITNDWWQSACRRDRERFLSAVERGQLEVAALAWHMTPLMDHAMLLRALEHVEFFRSLGVPVRSAMNTDVNGLPWGVVDALLDHGISGLSMSINEHFGHALRPWPRAFRWEAPGGRTLLAYNGFIYGITSEGMLRIPVDMEEARVRVPEWTKLWESRGYPHEFLMMQATNVRFHDNGSPNPDLAPFVRRWNESSPEVRLRFVTLSEFFDLLRAEPEERLPVMRGDWTDWWNFGAGSTAAQTAQALEGQRHLVDARALDAWGDIEEPRRGVLEAESRRALTLFCEHTWGADRSTLRPGSIETRSQQLLKLALAPQGASLARMLRRDGLERLARRAGGEEPRLLVWNPHPFPVSSPLRLPQLPPLAEPAQTPLDLHLDEFVPHGPESHRVQRQDVVLADTPDEMSFWSEPVELPPLSFRTVPAAHLRPGGEGLYASGARLGNEYLEVELDDRGGLASLRAEGTEYAGEAEGLRLGLPVLETVVSEEREAIFGPIDRSTPDWHQAWHGDWEAGREHGALRGTEAARVERGAARASQSFDLRNGDRAVVTYRLATGERALELQVEVQKAPDARPHALYLPLSTALSGNWGCDFETAGAVVRLDEEQLPYASRHFLTTQRWIRLRSEAGELAVATPDVPLWQVGGFTFGRHRDPDGRVERTHPMLLAWLTNNYWNTNFQADQSGGLRFRFWLRPGTRRELGESIRGVLPYLHPPAVHLYAGHGEVRRSQGSLMHADIGQLLITALEPGDAGVAVTLLNPADEPATARFGPADLHPLRAWRTGLAGEKLEELACRAGEVSVSVGARAWTRIEIETNDSEKHS